MSVGFRLATAADSCQIAEQRRAFFLEQIGNVGSLEPDFVLQFARFVEDELRSERSAIWLAEEDRQLMAIAWVKIMSKVPWPGEWHARWAYVTNVYTVPERRGAGVGRELMDRVKAWAVDQHLEFLLLWPSDESVEWYHRLGFVDASEALIWHTPAGVS